MISFYPLFSGIQPILFAQRFDASCRSEASFLLSVSRDLAWLYRSGSVLFTQISVVFFSLTEFSISPNFFEIFNFLPLFCLLGYTLLLSSLHYLSDVRNEALDNGLYMIQNFLKPLNSLHRYPSGFVRQILPLYNLNVQE